MRLRDQENRKRGILLYNIYTLLNRRINFVSSHSPSRPCICRPRHEASGNTFMNDTYHKIEPYVFGLLK